jgi:hypothetical protein
MRRKARIIIYVCSAIKDGNLLSKMVEASSVDESCSFFEQENGIKPQVILGPFYKKKTGMLDKNFNIKFKFGPNIQAIYNGWHITAMPLSNPPESAYILFNKRVDGIKTHKPQSMVIKIKEIQEIK